mmetsp:Transcript_23693/g.39754  ORF Transcript_23693/g.39754 Transcript_23693/m.39754 type:complete len:142 (+) Transcript_23693:236-661(+)|eukprot:CAMPEP_0198209312 /NCGR_PEP_ID=MMETSP1445-20131203/14838_1 /TAXON_ID=36898 /ORGANISM="Pyramimonas sp., Strain CCMP2087" /LENGTH=141 /DNA_ID=CAMNT_0043883049 /DNA_START=187 /DNA_END=612 /DNA_ORIENTATION=-
MGVFHEVARRGDSCSVDYLRRELVADKQLAHINEKDLDGWTPLHFACLKGNDQAALVLVKKGADSNAKTKMGRTPLFFACMKNMQTVVRAMLDAVPKAADSQIRDKTGKKAIDVCPDGECKVMLWDYEEGGNPNKPADEME